MTTNINNSPKYACRTCMKQQCGCKDTESALPCHFYTEQPKQEPVGYFAYDEEHNIWEELTRPDAPGATPLYAAPQPVIQEPVGTAGELFTMSTLERLDVRPSTKVYLDSTPSVAEIVLKSCIYFDSIDFSQTPPFLRYDTGDSTPQDNWNVYCDIQDELREFGYELTDSDVDHDTVCGDVTPIAADRSKNGII